METYGDHLLYWKRYDFLRIPNSFHRIAAILTLNTPTHLVLKAFQVLRKSGVNVQMISQGASKVVLDKTVLTLDNAVSMSWFLISMLPPSTG